MVTKYSRVVPPFVLVCFAGLTISNLQAEAAKSKKRTPTPTVTAVAAKPAAAAASTSAPAVPTKPPAVAAPAASPPAAAPAGPAKADVEAGKALYVKNCQKCHGPEGEGVKRMYDLVGAKLMSISAKPTQSKSDAELKKTMLDGVGKMEPVEDITPQQADKILAFVRTLSEAKH